MNKVHLANFRLSHAHLHGWAGFSTLQFFNENGEASIESLKNFYIEKLDDRDIPGVFPSPKHTTGTGRVSWEYSSGKITIGIHRPGKIVGNPGGDIVVIEIQASLNPDGTIKSIDSVKYCRLAEERHWSAMLYCLKTLGVDLIESETLWKEIVYKITKKLPGHENGWSGLYKEEVETSWSNIPECFSLEYKNNRWHPLGYLICPHCGVYFLPEDL